MVRGVDGIVFGDKIYRDPGFLMTLFLSATTVGSEADAYLF